MEVDGGEWGLVHCFIMPILCQSLEYFVLSTVPVLE